MLCAEWHGDVGGWESGAEPVFGAHTAGLDSLRRPLAALSDPPRQDSPFQSTSHSSPSHVHHQNCELSLRRCRNIGQRKGLSRVR